MEERKHEIKVHRDVQRAAHKASSEERHRVAMESKARQSKVKTLTWPMDEFRVGYAIHIERRNA